MQDFRDTFVSKRDSRAVRSETFKEILNAKNGEAEGIIIKDRKASTGTNS